MISEDRSVHIPVPDIQRSKTLDETGCGDQVTAVVSAELAMGNDVDSAAKQAILAGTLQFNRLGIQPVSIEDLKNINPE